MEIRSRVRLTQAGSSRWPRRHVLWHFSAFAGVAGTVSNLNIGVSVLAAMKQWNAMVQCCCFSIYRLSANLANSAVAIEDYLKVNMFHIGVSLAQLISTICLSGLIAIGGTPTIHACGFYGSVFLPVLPMSRSFLFGIGGGVPATASVDFLSISGVVSQHRRFAFFWVLNAVLSRLLPQQFSFVGRPSQSHLSLAFLASRLQSVQARLVLRKGFDGLGFVA